MTDITVMVVGPQDISVQQVAPDYRVFNRLVGGEQGAISICGLPPTLRAQGLCAFCDDNGIARELPANAFATHVGQAVLRGPIVLFRDDGHGNEVSLRLADIELLEDYFKAPPSPEARALTRQSQLWWQRYPSGFAIADADTGVVLPSDRGEQP